MEYHEVDNFDKSKIEENINSKNAEKIINAILSTVFYSGEYEYSQEIIFRFIENEDENIRGIAILSLGHLARIFGKINKNKAMKYIKQALNDHSEFVRGHADSAKSDINFFIK